MLVHSFLPKSLLSTEYRLHRIILPQIKDLLSQSTLCLESDIKLTLLNKNLKRWILKRFIDLGWVWESYNIWEVWPTHKKLLSLYTSYKSEIYPGVSFYSLRSVWKRLWSWFSYLFSTLPVIMLVHNNDCYLWAFTVIITIWFSTLNNGLCH